LVSRVVRRLPILPLFPYTTLFRSEEATPAELEDAPVKRDVELDEALGRRSLAPDRLEGRRDRRDIRANRGSATDGRRLELEADRDRKSTRLNSSHRTISYAVFCLK